MSVIWHLNSRILGASDTLFMSVTLALRQYLVTKTQHAFSFGILNHILVLLGYQAKVKTPLVVPGYAMKSSVWHEYNSKLEHDSFSIVYKSISHFCEIDLLLGQP